MVPHDMGSASMSDDDMDMSGMDMGGMSDMSMDAADAASVHLQEVYWAVVGAVIAVFFLVNLYTKYLAWQRRRSHSRTPARPQNMFTRSMAAITATMREVISAPMRLVTPVNGWSIVAPSYGKVLIVLSNAAILLILSFHGFNPRDIWSFENIGYRLGRVTVCQLPLLFLLAGKRNIVAALIGSSYERINWLHRWAARTMLLTTTIHMGYWFADWNRYGYVSTKVATDSLTQRGLAAWAILLWITISSMTPIRGWAYEFFVFQHVVSFTAFVVMVWFHVPDDVKIYVWICVGIFFLDRLLRAASYLHNNLLKYHAAPDASGGHRDIWGSRAEFTALPGGCTKITIPNPPTKWRAGQHVFLTCHSLAPLQAHPFTISSIPSDGKMEFIVQARAGGTKRFLGHAEARLPQTRHDVKLGKHVAIEGPYGRVRPLQQFDSVIFFAGSTGATFTMPLLRDLVHSLSAKQKVVTRRVKFVWVVKAGCQLQWFKDQLSQVVEDAKALRSAGVQFSVGVSLYITCDDVFTSEHATPMAAAGVFEDADAITKCSAPAVTGKMDVVRVSIDEKSATKTTQSHRQCCCRGDVDEDASNAPICTCSCCGIEPVSGGSDNDSGSSVKDTKKPKATSTPLLHPEIQLFSGRPKVKDITRAELEQALGESAVVACGPRGLISDVRLSTVQLSDERAVHRGTGAQGIWLHTEAFGY